MNIMKAEINANYRDGGRYATGTWSIRFNVCGRPHKFGFFNSYEDAEDALNYITKGWYEIVETLPVETPNPVPTLEQELNDPHNEWGTWDCGA